MRAAFTIKNIYPVLSFILMIVSIFFILKGEYAQAAVFMAVASVVMGKGRSGMGRVQKILQRSLLLTAVVALGYAIFRDYMTNCI